ncbi:MAG TPA: hypothetical protein VFR37_13945, partial [Longimicrobium sp.]|nr:hypothetical protein [Longimicrobium sp.]
MLRNLIDRLAVLDEVDMSPLPLGIPGGGLTTPTASGASWGDFGIGFGFRPRLRYGNGADGAIGGVMGFGNPMSVGLDVGVTVLDVRSSREGRGGFGRRGTFTFKAHRLLAEELSVAVAVENALTWGGTNAPRGVYAVATKRFRLADSYRVPFSRLCISLGVGTGRFRTERQVARQEGTVGLFGSASVTLSRALVATIEWTGQDVGIGASLAPFSGAPLNVTVGILDVAGIA